MRLIGTFRGEEEVKKIALFLTSEGIGNQYDLLYDADMHPCYDLWIFEEEDFVSVTLPTISGQITILPGHVPLIGGIVYGEITAKKKGKLESLAITNGFFKLDFDGVLSIYTDYAVRSDDIELEKVMVAKTRAEAIMKNRQSDREFMLAEADLKRTLLEIKIAHKRKAQNF